MTEATDVSVPEPRKPKLLDQVRHRCRVRHLALKTGARNGVRTFFLRFPRFRFTGAAPLPTAELGDVNLSVCLRLAGTTVGTKGVCSAAETTQIFVERRVEAKRRRPIRSGHRRQRVGRRFRRE
jgi:hypothetical protein